MEENQTVAALQTTVAVIVESLKHRDNHLNELFNEVRGIRSDIKAFGSVQDSHIHGLATLENRMTKQEQFKETTSIDVAGLKSDLDNLKIELNQRITNNRFLITVSLTAVSVSIGLIAFLSTHVKFGP